MRSGFFDIETVTLPHQILRQSLGQRPIDMEQFLLEHAADGALSGLTGQVACIGVADEVGDPTTWIVKGYELEAERIALLRLERWLNTAAPDVLVGHNVREFDVPFVRARALRHGLNGLARELRKRAAVPSWSTEPPRICDTLDRPLCPRGKSTKGWTLSALAELLGVEVRPTVPGSEIPASWMAGEFDAVAAHCREDVRVLREVYFGLVKA